jgi:hypothetical protein
LINIASKFSLRASSAFKLFEFGLRSLKLSSSGQQCLQIIQARASVPRTIFFGPAAPLHYSSTGTSPSNCLFQASSASALFEFGFWTLQFASFGHRHFCSGSSPSNLCFRLSTLSAQNTRILVAIYQFGCRMANKKVSPRFATPDGPVFVSNALCREIFHTYGMKFAPMDASGASQ